MPNRRQEGAMWGLYRVIWDSYGVDTGKYMVHMGPKMVPDGSTIYKDPKIGLMGHRRCVLWI